MTAARKWLIAGVAMTAGAICFAAQYRSQSQAQYYDRGGVPTWDIDKTMPNDAFTFVRIRYSSFRARGWGWDTDWPDAELNLCWRLQQMTSMKVHPDSKVLDLTDKELFDHPFIYIIEPGDMVLSEDEVAALRRYLLNGGFLMVDDFWGTRQWMNFYREIKRVFPEREPEELDISHPIFTSVFPLKEKPQVPAIGWAVRGRPWGITWENHDGEECRDVHFKGIFDDKGRMMAIICHNTDLGDGWEREGEDEWFFREFAEKKSYPMAINIIFYAMTH